MRLSAQVAKAVSKLSLQRGDVLLCSDPRLMESLARVRIPTINFALPIIYAPEGSLSKCTRKQLIEALEHLPPDNQPLIVEAHRMPRLVTR